MRKFTKGLLTGALALTIVGTSGFTFADTYKVQSGDTYWKVSQKLEVDIHSLLEVNGASSSSQLRIGQVINLPDKQGDYKTYTVVEGDTPWIISEKLEVNLDKLLSLNNLSDNSYIYVGQTLNVPNLESSENEVKNDSENYTVESGDTLWIISQKLKISIRDLMSVNDLNESSQIYPGQKLVIPTENTLRDESNDSSYYTIQKGDTLWIISQKLDINIRSLMDINNLIETSQIHPGEKLIIPEADSDINNVEDKEEAPTVTETKPYKTYDTHVVKSGENFWTISMDYGIQMHELLSANNATSSTMLSIGDEIKIPVYNVPIMETLGEKYGEYQDWWKAAQYIVPLGSEFKVIDFYTGKSFNVKRTLGANHADVEAMTAEDTKIMKEIWGGNLTWSSRPSLVIIDGRKIAASVSAMPHAGNDNAPGGAYTTWRSGDYGAGQNFDYVKENDMHGVFDIHFLNSTRHKDGKVSETHQKNVKIAAGLLK